MSVNFTGNRRAQMTFLGHPTVKKWIAHSGEWASFLVFTGFGLLRGDLVKNDYVHFSDNGYQPKYLLGWVAAGLTLGLCRVLAGRYAKAEARGILSTPDYVKNYRKMLSTAIEDLAICSGCDKKALDEFEDSLLLAIADTVLYYRKATTFFAPPVTCSLMTPIAPADEHKNSLWLEEGGFSNLACVLVIEKASRQELDIPAGFALPVYDLMSPMRDKNLYGAPRAFVTHEYEVVNLTFLPLKHRHRTSWPVFKRTVGYFWSQWRTLCSFASFPLMVKGKSTGVVNVHYRWIRILGKNPELLIDFLLPFLSILGYIHSEKEKKDIDREHDL